MKKKVFFLIGILLAGTLSYYSAYYAYTSNHSGSKMQETQMIQKAVPLQQNAGIEEEQSYYLAQIEDQMLYIYKMPEKDVYDSLKLSSLHFTKKEQMELLKGLTFQNLTEVFEFLENSMS